MPTFAKNLLVVLLPLSTLISTSVQQTCYFPNGLIAAGNVACNSGTDASFCCGPGYACLENKVCQWTTATDESDPGIEFDRGSCTDQTWKSDNCPQFCLGADQDMEGGNAMAQCNTTAFICFSNQISANCTTGVNAFHLPGTNAITTIGVAGSGVTSSASSSSSSTASSSSASSSAATTSSASAATTSASSSGTGSATAVGASATSSPAPAVSKSSGLSAGAKAGIAVGVILGVAALAAIAFFFWSQRRRRSNEYRQPDSYYQPNGKPYSDRKDNRHLSEAPSPAPAYNKPYNQVPQEMHVPPTELHGSGSYPGVYEMDSR